MTLLLQVGGAGLIVLSLFHVVLWKALGWSREIALMSPLAARVFAVHAFFIAFVLFALGLLSLLHPELLLEPSPLAKLLLGATVLFWIARLLIQPLVFDPVMRAGFTKSVPLRVGVTFLWLGYAALYSAAFLRQSP